MKKSNTKEAPSRDRRLTSHFKTAPRATAEERQKKKHDSEAVERFIEAGRSSATRRAYARDLKHFMNAGGKIPANDALLAAYLAGCAHTNAVSTLARRLSAIHAAHVERRLPSPARTELVRRTMNGIRRELGTRQRQVKPLVRDELLEVLAAIDQQSPLKAARDRALVLFGFASALRRSELIAVRMEHLHGVDAGLEILVPRSKTDQEGNGRTVFVPFAHGECCPVQAMTEWLSASGINEGYVFRSVSRHDRISDAALTAQSVALIVKSAVLRAGRSDSEVSGHSLRAGYCTAAAEAGLQAWQIRQQTGHRCDATLEKYIRPVRHRKIPSIL